MSGHAPLPLLVDVAGALLLQSRGPRGPFSTIFLWFVEHREALVLLDGFLFMSTGILGRSSESQFEWCFSFLSTWIVQLISNDVCSRLMLASAAPEVLCTSQNKHPMCSSPSMRPLRAMEVLDARSLGH